MIWPCNVRSYKPIGIRLLSDGSDLQFPQVCTRRKLNTDRGHNNRPREEVLSCKP